MREEEVVSSSKQKNVKQILFKTEDNPADEMWSPVIQEDLCDGGLDWAVRVT